MARRKWKRVEPYKGKVHQGCLNCPPVLDVAPMDTIVAVGFGSAEIMRDGDVVYAENPHAKGLHFRRLRSFERMAAKDPDHDWRLILDAPLRSRTYQRHGEKKWVLIASGLGFA
jgi:hypothetical protein